MSTRLGSQPTIVTTRLMLRPFVIEDAPYVQRLAGAREVAETTTNIPHPYEDGMAEAWIRRLAEAYASSSESTFAIVRRAGAVLIGSIGLRIEPSQERGELGYWIGVPYWNQGYCTEAAEAVLRHGFDELGLHRIWASHFVGNPSSARVMQKIGMSHEGRLRHHFQKWGVPQDLEVYGVLAPEWRERRSFL